MHAFGFKPKCVHLYYNNSDARLAKYAKIVSKLAKSDFEGD
jgi:hypothetical protein